MPLPPAVNSTDLVRMTAPGTISLMVMVRSKTGFGLTMSVPMALSSSSGNRCQ
jgi:hypothetical protein